MQEAAATTAQPPAAPAVRIDAGPTTTAQTIAIPQNVQDIAGLRSRREELVDQLDRARNRRSGVITEMRDASGVERAGLEQRLSTIDQRIVQIEADIGATERALTNTPTSLLGAAAQAEEAARAAREANQPPIDEDMIAVFGMFTMFMMVPLVIAYTRRIWKRPQPVRALPASTEGRLERIEQAVEAIAIEVERVSEGQRFVTRLLSDTSRAPQSLPSER